MRSTLIGASSTPFLSRNFILICISNALVFFTFQLLLPTLPLFVREVGGRQDVVGLVIGVFTLAAVISRPWIGRWVDLRGRRDIYLISLLVFLVTTVSYLGMTAIWPLLILRAIHGLAWGAVTTTAGTVATDLIPSHRQGEGMGYYGLFTLISGAFGPFFGLWIIENYSFTVLFFISTCLVAIAWTAAQKIKYPPVSSISPAQLLERKARESFIPKGTGLPSLMVLCSTLTLGAISTYLPLFAADRKISNIGLFFTVYALAMVCSRLWSGKLFDRKGPLLGMISGLCFMTLSLILISFTQDLKGLLFSAILYGLGFGSVHPSLQAWTIQRASNDAKGRANGTFFAAFDLGIGLGSILAGLIVEWLGYSPMFLLCIVPIIFTVPLFLRAR